MRSISKTKAVLRAILSANCPKAVREEVIDDLVVLIDDENSKRFRLAKINALYERISEYD